MLTTGAVSTVIAAVVLVALFIAFAREWRPPEVCAVVAVAILLVTGVISVDDALSVFSNSAPVTIAAMFILSAALVRTGVIDVLARALTRSAKHIGAGPAVLLMLLFVIPASAFMNNTPLVMLMIPVAVSLAKFIGWSPSKLLIPVSYASILGGTCTLIGTSTNILVDGVAREAGLAPFHIFEIAPVGVLAALAGLAVLMTSRWLLPQRTTLAVLEDIGKDARFLVEGVVKEGSALIGRRAGEAPFAGSERRLVDVMRAGRSLRARLAEVTLRAGDVLVLKTSVADALTLRESGELASSLAADVQSLGARATRVVETLVGPNAEVIGRSLDQLGLRRRFNVYPLALHRRGENVSARLRTTPLQVGDTLLLEGAPDDIKSLVEEEGLVNVAEPRARGYRVAKAPIAGLTLAGVVVGAALGVMPLAGLAIIGAAVVLATRCVEAQEAFEAIDWRVLTLIVAMLAIGAGLENAGLIELIVQASHPLLAVAPPIVALALTYILASILTEAVTNNAVAVVLTPIVIALAISLGLDPRPFVVVVMFAASASFMTPIGYQTNTLVYSAGGYRFTDFLRLGLPLNIVVGTVVVVAVPYFWPLQ